MNYNKRVTLLFEEKKEGYLGEEVVETVEKIYPCNRSLLTNNEQMGIFGKYSLSAFKLHIQGHHEGFSKVKYDGQIRSLNSLRYHKNSTVVIVNG